MKVKSLTVLAFLATAGYGQSVGVFIETDQVFSSENVAVNYGGTIDGQTLNAFYAVTDLSIAALEAKFDSITGSSQAVDLFDDFTWAPMQQWTANAGAQWFATASVAVDSRPIVAFANASSLSDLVAGSEIGLLASIKSPGSQLDNYSVGFSFGNTYSVIVGSAGSITLDVVPVPEPSVYAALLGLGALGFVMWRRRRN